jgi:multidrug efflux pump subunit AcrB
MQQPLAIAIISGLVPKLPLVLIVLPIMLTLQTGAKKEQGEPNTPRGQ